MQRHCSFLRRTADLPRLRAQLRFASEASRPARFAMPLVTVTLQRPKTREFKSKVLDAVHDALVHVGVPPTDKFQRVLELDADDFRFDPLYPDATTARTSDFVLIEILWSVGRSVKIKKQLLSFLVRDLTSKGFEVENIMVVFKETQWENWSFAGGRQIHT